MRRLRIGCPTSPVELHTQVVDPKTDKKRFTPAQVDKWQDMDVLTVLDVLIEPNAAEIVDGNSLVVALENIELGALGVLRLALL
jgi:hypothetical protein